MEWYHLQSKVKYIKETSLILRDKYEGDIPRTPKELMALPGKNETGQHPKYLFCYVTF